MSRSFGPVVAINPDNNTIDRVHCHWCIFREWASKHASGGNVCTYVDRKNPTQIPDPAATPDFCEMKAGAIQDALDHARGVHHFVMRWSGRKTDEPREIYCGIPSEALRQFKLASRDAKRGTVRLENYSGGILAQWPDVK